MTEILFSKAHHVGVVVRDMDKAIERYQSLGIGPFEPSKSFDVVEREFLSKPIDAKTTRLKARFTDLGPIRLELIQPLEGNSLAQKFLETNGEGINQG